MTGRGEEADAGALSSVPSFLGGNVVRRESPERGGETATLVRWLAVKVNVVLLAVAVVDMFGGWWIGLVNLIR